MVQSPRISLKNKIAGFGSAGRIRGVKLCTFSPESLQRLTIKNY